MIKFRILLAATAVLVSVPACDNQSADKSGTAEVNVTPVAPPAGKQWSDVVTQTAQGGYLMGNPGAAVKVVEFASMTCPHCAEFDENGMQALIDKYVKTGQVSLEFRNFVRDPFDLSASVIARCGGPERFYPLTRGLLADQKNWTQRLSTLPQEQLQALQALPPTRQFLEIARLAGMQQWAAQRGLPSARSSQCLQDENEINRLVQMNSDATTEHPEFKGTPTFVVNGDLVDGATWKALEPELRKALGG